MPDHVKTFGGEVSEVCDLAGFTPDPEQRLALDMAFAVDRNGRAAARDVGVVVPRQNMKALAWDTPILSTRGWVQMVDLTVGDHVYSPSGSPVAVTAVSDVKMGQRCYLVSTTDGRSVVADAGHLWTVLDTRTKRMGTVTTQTLVDAGLDRGAPRTVVTDGVRYRTREYRWQLPTQMAVESPDAELPLDPYLFGAWLGDGSSICAELSSHGDDVPHWFAEIVRAGFVPTAHVGRTCTTVGITTRPGPGRHARSFGGRLRELGVLGHKAVPDAYLTASARQREALLQGLMDTDGTISKAGQASFCGTRRGLAEAVLYLARSLGWRANIRESRALLNGVDCGEKFDVMFTPKAHDPYSPFRLARKRAMVRDGEVRAGRFTVSIRSIEPVESVPVLCIKVDSADGLFLAGRGLMVTHNTGWLKQCALGWLYVLELRLIVWSAHEFATAQESFRDMCQLIESCPDLDAEVKQIHRGNGDEAIELTGDRRLKFKARTKSGGRGLTGDRVVLDEAMLLKPDMLGALLPTLRAVPDPQVVYAGSAGLLESKDWRNVRDRGRAGGDPSLAYAEWCDLKEWECADPECSHLYGLVKGCGLDDECRWWAANPALGRRVSIDSLRADRRSMPPTKFATETLGWWEDPPTADGADDVLTGWDDAKSGRAPSGGLSLGVDVSADSRSAAIVACGGRALEVVDYRKGAGTAWVPGRVAELRERHKVTAVGLIGGRSPALPLAKDIPGCSVLTDGEAAQASVAFARDVNEGRLSHRGQAALDIAVTSAARQLSGDGWRWSRRLSRADISPLLAAVVAAHLDGLPVEVVDRSTEALLTSFG